MLNLYQLAVPLHEILLEHHNNVFLEMVQNVFFLVIFSRHEESISTFAVGLVQRSMPGIFWLSARS